jgi:hypothetical protein
MVRLTKHQQVALRRIYQRNQNNGKTYLEFRRLVFPGPGCVMVPWAGMVLGIEPDGYTHS